MTRTHGYGIDPTHGARIEGTPGEQGAGQHE